MTAEQKTQRKARTMGSLWMLLLTAFMYGIYRWSPDLISIIARVPIDQVSDIGPEAIQRVFIAMFSGTAGILYATAIASFVENQLRPDAFGNTSRWGVLFGLALLSYSILAS